MMEPLLCGPCGKDATHLVNGLPSCLAHIGHHALLELKANATTVIIKSVDEDT